MAGSGTTKSQRQVGAAGLLVTLLALGAGPQDDWASAWQALDSAQADAAAARLAAGGPAAARWLVDRLLNLPDPERAARLIEDLNADRFETRERATAGLIRLGPAAEPLVRVALAAGPPPEAESRLGLVLARLSEGDDLAASHVRRQARAVAVLAGAGEAGRPLLREVAERTPWTATRQAACAALLADARDRARAGDRSARADADLVQRLDRGPGLGDAASLLEQAAEIPLVLDAAERVAQLRAAGAAAPADPAAKHRLAWALAVELDRPQEALAVAEVGDADFTARVRELAQPSAALSVDARAALARWCVAEARDASELGQRQLMRRAAALLDAALADAVPGQREALQQTLAQVEDRLDALGIGTERWANLLDPRLVAEPAPVGDWVRTAGGLTVRAGRFSTLNLSLAPGAAYTLRVRFRRVEGNDGVMIVLPADTSRADLNLGGWGNTVSGLEMINGAQAVDHKDPDLGRAEGLENGRVYDLVARVRVVGEDATIAVQMDGRPYLKWSGKPGEIAVNTGAWSLNDKPGFALGANQSVVQFSLARVRVSVPAEPEKDAAR